ncbi:MAG: hypothetical protein ACOWWM_19120 [Desulfobacterales bacterium]
MLRSGKSPLFLTVMALICTSLLAAGCGPGKKRAQPLDPSNDRLAPPLEIRPVGRKQLSPRIAFVPFENRTALDNSLLDQVFYDRLIPEMVKKADRTRVVLPGDVDFPAGIQAFGRDVYGRLDSFGLAVYARQQNLNAVVSGMVLDAAVSNELSGMLLWKRTEGRLRVLMLAEVYSAEGGTKLMSEVFEFEAEVPGMAPDAAGGLRDTDLPLVREGLAKLAGRIGKRVSGVISELPWQGYVTNVAGNRITLSSNSDSGLEPGNILMLYDSQVLDGLDGRKFFLPSDPVGRMQVTDVLADRVEGVLLQGSGVGIYSFAAP